MKDNSKDIYDLIEDYFSEEESMMKARNLLQAYESQKSTEGTTSGNKLNQEASEGLGKASASIKGKKVLVWKSWGEVSVYSLETEEECRIAFVNILDAVKSELTSQEEVELETRFSTIYTIEDIVQYVNLDWSDWEMFETLRITYVE